MRCTDPECGHEWPVKSALGEEDACIECGAEAEPIDAWDDEIADLKPGPTIDRPRLILARAQALDLLRTHGVTAAPVPVREIAETLGFTIKDRRALGVLRGRLIGSTIEVAEADREAVKRFTIAHELGHHSLGTTHQDGDSAEREADTFAGELLVPGPLLLEAVKETRDTRQLARHFQVSLTALRKSAETHNKAQLLT